MPESSIPSVVAMLICDQIITEVGTNKKSLVGIFDRFVSLNFPAPVQRLAVYVKLADALGDYSFKLRIVKLKDESLIGELAIQASISNMDSYAELAVNLVNAITVPEAGKYEFQLYAGDNYLHRVTMQAELAKLPAGGPQWPRK